MNKLDDFVKEWQDRFAEAVESDFENGVRWLSAEAAERFKRDYPRLSMALFNFANINRTE